MLEGGEKGEAGGGGGELRGEMIMGREVRNKDR